MEKTDLLKKRVLFITGKGGVGKTTISAILGITAKKMGKKVLICEINTKEKIAPLLGYEEVGSEITEVESNLFIVNINPKDALKEYGLMLLKSKILYNTIFENKFVKKFLDGLPGFSELITIGKIAFHEAEKDKNGNNKYDIIIIDAPSTGHGITFLKFPMTVLKVLKSGALFEEEKKINDLLKNKDKTAINIVTQPEELPINESKELYNIIKNELEMPIGCLFINNVFLKLFPNELCDDFKLIQQYIQNDEFEHLKNAALYQISRQNLNNQYIEIAQKEINMKNILIPYIFSENFSRKDILYLSELLLNSLYGI